MDENSKKEYINKLCKTPEGENIKKILENKGIYNLECGQEIIDALMQSQDGKKVIENNFKAIVKLLIIDENFYDFIEQFIKTEVDFINNNIYVILKEMDNNQIPILLNFLPKQIRNELFENNKYIVLMNKEKIINDETFLILLKNGLNSFIKLLLEELSNGKPIKKLGRGVFSEVLETNGYIIKIGEERAEYNVPYHPKILQPLLKARGINLIGESKYVIEVQNECNTIGATIYQAEKLRRKLEESGIQWYDAHYKNIGKLKVPNKRVLPIGTKDNPAQNGSFDIGIPEIILGEGELVIIDADDLEFEPNNNEEIGDKSR